MDISGIEEEGKLYETIAGMLSPTGRGRFFIRDDIARIIFYSSAIEGNKLDESEALMLINGDLEIGSGRLIDYIELLNHKDVYNLIAQIGDNEITLDDIIKLRKLLFSNTLNNLHYGLRRSMTSVEDYITESASKLPKEMEELIEILNRKPSNASDAFSNAVEFHLLFVDRHPFEDGNGRTVRLLMNWYLIKNGLVPIIVTREDKKEYFNSINPFHFCGYTDVFASFMLYSALKTTGISVAKYSEGIEKESMIKDFLLMFDGKIDEASLSRKVSSYYSSGNKRQKLGAMWIAGHLNVQSPELSIAAQEDDPEIVSMALLAMQNRALNGFEKSIEELDKFTGRIRELAIAGREEREQLLAISLLGKISALDNDTVRKIIEGQKDSRIIAQTFNALRYNPTNQDSVALLEGYLSSSNPDLAENAYAAFIANAPIPLIEKHLEGICNEEEVVKDEIIKWLSRIRKKAGPEKISAVNLDSIAKILVNAAIKDDRIRMLLLGQLSTVDGLNSEYLDILKRILKDTSFNDVEKSYAAYCIGINKGYNYLHSETGIGVQSTNGQLLNMSAFIALTNGKAKEGEILDALDIKQNSVNIVDAISMKNMLEKNRFGTDFLLLCEKNFSVWNNMRTGN
ncbi:MAG: Fic family protein [Candidatus Marsarchaeota archaeon]|jgi:Fic family protein|nr:Fic family protein [Candidatus Marsarchaeota archaeon]